MDRKNKSPHTNNDSRDLAIVAISLLAGKWTIGIILALADGKQRFAALQRCLRGISHHVLTKELKRLTGAWDHSPNGLPNYATECRIWTHQFRRRTVCSSTRGVGMGRSVTLIRLHLLMETKRLPSNCRERIGSDEALMIIRCVLPK